MNDSKTCPLRKNPCLKLVTALQRSFVAQTLDGRSVKEKIVKMFKENISTKTSTLME